LPMTPDRVFRAMAAKEHGMGALPADIGNAGLRARAGHE